AADMYPAGRPPLEGERIRRPDLAKTLEAIAERGRSGFYAGNVAEALAAAVDGNITGDDLDRVQADWVEPLGIDVFGHKAWTIPPNCRGYRGRLSFCFVETIGILQPAGPEAWHLSREAYLLAATVRDDVYSGPEAMIVTLSALVYT